MSPASGEKICVICGESCADKPRVKDPKGRYYCRACYDEAQERLKAKKDEPHAASTDDQTPPEPTSQQEQEPQSDPDMPDFSDPPSFVDDDRDMGPFDKSLLDDDEIGLESEGGGGGVGADNCPGCGAALAADAVLCVQCGFNLQTGEAVKPSVEADADDDEADADADADDRPSGPTVWPSVVGVISMVIGGCALLWALGNSALGALAIQNPMEVVFIIFGLFIMAAVWIWPVWGGFWLFKRRPGGARMLRIWSIAMIAVFGTLLVGLAVMIPIVGDAITEALGEVTGEADDAAVLGGVAMGVMFALVAALAVILLAWPTILLIWLSRARVRAEVSGWRTGAEADAASEEDDAFTDRGVESPAEKW